MFNWWLNLRTQKSSMHMKVNLKVALIFFPKSDFYTSLYSDCNKESWQKVKSVLKEPHIYQGQSVGVNYVYLSVFLWVGNQCIGVQQSSWLKAVTATIPVLCGSSCLRQGLHSLRTCVKWTLLHLNIISPNRYVAHEGLWFIVSYGMWRDLGPYWYREIV